MPSRHRTKLYVGNGYYHIFNRGVEKRLIFLDKQDYAVFLSYLKDYLTPKDTKNLEKQLIDPSITSRHKDRILHDLKRKNYSQEILLLAYCLMPNHFHLCIKQIDDQSINKFMHSLFTRYTMYFNKKYNRVGNLCQDIYKAVLIETDEQLIYLSKYIHKQALGTQGPALEANQPSSYHDYLGQRRTEWVHPEEVLTFFSKSHPQLNYQVFIEQVDDFSNIQILTIDD